MNKAYKSALEANRKAIIEYMKSKILLQDWHAVSDAANDLREIDAQLNLIDTFHPERAR